MMGTSTSTRRSGGHHMNVTFSMTSDTELMWMTLGCDRHNKPRLHVLCSILR